jgi:hypothetical protein
MILQQLPAGQHVPGITHEGSAVVPQQKPLYIRCAPFRVRQEMVIRKSAMPLQSTGKHPTPTHRSRSRPHKGVTLALTRTGAPHRPAVAQPPELVPRLGQAINFEQIRTFMKQNLRERMRQARNTRHGLCLTPPFYTTVFPKPHEGRNSHLSETGQSGSPVKPATDSGGACSFSPALSFNLRPEEANALSYHASQSDGLRRDASAGASTSRPRAGPGAGGEPG